MTPHVPPGGGGGVSRVGIVPDTTHVFFPPYISRFSSCSSALCPLPPARSDLPACRAFTVTAVAQMCILGLMWVFGAFLFREGTVVVAYIFTILNSLQGALLFVMHCLLSKQVSPASPPPTLVLFRYLGLEC